MLSRDLFSWIRNDIRELLRLPLVLPAEAGVLVVTGDNATGKSFVRRLVGIYCDMEKWECISISQEGRTSHGTMAAAMYGSEGHLSTGSISSQTLLSGHRTSMKRDRPHVLVYDEPAIGMSEESRFGAALWMSLTYSKEWPEHLQALVVMTHDRYFVEELSHMKGFVFLNLDGYEKASDWLARDIRPRPPQEVHDFSIARYRELSKMLTGD